METKRIKVLIDNEIKNVFGPEVCWVWRLLFTSIGYCWAEVDSPNEDCDVVYSAYINDQQNVKIHIRADIRLWQQMSTLKICDLVETDRLTHLLYGNQPFRNSIISKNGHGITIERDLILDIFYFVTGQQERYWRKDKHGIFNLSDNTIFVKHVLQKALVSCMLDWLKIIFNEAGFYLPLPRWPNNKSAAACLTHDVDYPEIKRVVEPFRIIQRLGTSGLPAAVDVIRGRRTHWHFSSWLKLEKTYGFRSAFYFVPVRGSLLKYALGRPDPFYDVKSRKFIKLFDYLTSGGAEIGLHASYLAYKDKDLFSMERETLKQVTGQEIAGNRHHYWHLNPDDIESTLLIHEQIGLKYDTSLSHDKYLGWRRAISCPFFPFHQEKRREINTLQIQTAWMDAQLFDLNNRKYADRLKILVELAEITASQGGCLNINIHDYVFDDLLFPGWSKTYHWFINYLNERSDFWIATPVEIADHWIKRYISILDFSYGLKEGL